MGANSASAKIEIASRRNGSGSVVAAGSPALMGLGRLFSPFASWRFGDPKKFTLPFSSRVSDFFFELQSIGAIAAGGREGQGAERASEPYVQTR